MILAVVLAVFHLPSPNAWGLGFFAGLALLAAGLALYLRPDHPDGE